MIDRPEDGPVSSDIDLTQAQPSRAHSIRTIGPYRLLQQVGEGGMGEVWLAEQTQPVRRQVALKVIKAGMDTAQVVVRFEAERQALALMDHPAIAHVFDAGATPEGRPYFAMEYVRGESITAYCARHTLSIADRLDLFLQVCEGVQHAHQKGVIHRDLKPSNVLVTLQDNRPVPKIIDFGVAKATTQTLTERTLYTEMGALVGTPEYMSPEQAEMTGLDVDTRTDVYALGVILYELLTGTLPFDAKALRDKGLDELRRTIREVDPPRPSTRVTMIAAGATARKPEASRLASQLRGDLDWITMRALEKDRTRRYGSASDLAADLRRHLDDLPVLAGPPSTVYRMRKFVRRHRTGVTVAVALAVLLVAFAATTGLQARRIARERDRANREAGIARAVSDFLQNDLLAQAGATTQASSNAKPDPDLKVRTALDRAAARLEGKFKSEPQVEASIRQTIGDTYVDLGLYPEAERQMERALDLRRQQLGDMHHDTLSTLNLLGDLYRLDGKYGQAEPLLTSLVDARVRTLGATHPDTLSAMNNLATVYKYEGKYPQAEAVYREVLNGRKGDPDIQSLTDVNNLGTLYFAEGKYGLSEKLLVEAAETSRRVLGKEHPVTITLVNNLALTYRFEGQYGQAEPLVRSVAEYTRRVLGEKHPNTLTALSNVAGLHRDQGKYAEAESLLVHVLASGRAIQGDDHPNTLRTMHYLAELYRDEGRYAEAEALAATALAARRRVLGESHPDTLSSMHNVAEIDRRQGKWAQADELFGKALDARRRALGEEHPDTLSTWASLGEVRFDAEQHAEAQSALREALTKYEKVAPNTWNRYYVQSLLGASLARQKDYAGAEPLLLSGYDGMTGLQARMPAYARYHIGEGGEWIVRLYGDWGKADKAAEWRAKVRKGTVTHE